MIPRITQNKILRATFSILVYSDSVIAIRITIGLGLVVCHSKDPAKCPSRNEWINKYGIHTMACYSALKKMNFENMLSETRQTQKDKYLILLT